MGDRQRSRRSRRRAPKLGTIEDFDDFVAAARDQGLEVALDLALQAAPDHPWAKEHPEWFAVLPDGTIAYAENPPKKYQDIYPINFDNDPAGLYDEVLRVVLFWISHGVKIFRVDNPHTKPPNFWAWLIGQVKATNPDVLFLAEAFTRPARLYGLAKLGFTQSYTYFTWRTAKWELTEFGEQIVEHADYAAPTCSSTRPTSCTKACNTEVRACSPSGQCWRRHSVRPGACIPATSCFEHRPVREGSEEYLDSEKYELRPRDFEAALAKGESLEPFLGRAQRDSPAAPCVCASYARSSSTTSTTTRCWHTASSTRSPETRCCVVVTLNPFGPEEATLSLDMRALGMQPYDRFWVRDEITGEEYQWGQSNYVRIDPAKAVAHVLNMPRIPPEQRPNLLRRE